MFGFCSHMMDCNNLLVLAIRYLVLVLWPTHLYWPNQVKIYIIKHGSVLLDIQIVSIQTGSTLHQFIFEDDV